MGNEYYLFKVSEKDDIQVRLYERIEITDLEYINYNKFLEKEYFTNIDDNCDFIPYKSKNQFELILRKDQFKITEIDEVFEILFDSLYGGE